jgi:hypothetical protein
LIAEASVSRRPIAAEFTTDMVAVSDPLTEESLATGVGYRHAAQCPKRFV